MTDWTTIFTTIGAAAIAAAGGWYGARKTAQVALQQIQGENKRLREQHREDHLRNRQGTYHDLMSAERRFSGSLALPDPQAAYERYLEFNHAANGAVLFGTDEVRAAVTELVEVYARIAREYGEPQLGGDWLNAQKQHADEINRARDAMLTAMRNDVAPQ